MTSATSGRRERFFTAQVSVLVFMSFLLGTSEFIIVGILPDIARDMHVPVTAVGALVSLFAFVYAPCTPVGAAICARFERFHALIVLLSVFLAGNLMSTFAINYPMLVASRVLTASVSGVLVAVSMTFGPDVAAADRQPRFISWVFSGFSVASVAGMPAGTWIGQTFGWRASFVVIDLLTLVMVAVMFAVLPKHSTPSKSSLAGQFRLFMDVRIILGVLAVVFGLAASYVWYTYLTPMFTDEIGVPTRFVSFALVGFGLACLWSNLHGGTLAARGEGIEPMTRMWRPYALQAVCMMLLPAAGLNPVAGVALLIVLGMTIYLQNSPSQVLFLHVATTRHPGSMTLASSLNSMSCNLGIALGSAVGGLAYDAVGLTWLGPVGAVFSLMAVLMTVLLRVDARRRDKEVQALG